MSEPASTVEIVQPQRALFDEARLAIAGFLARYSGPTRASYAADLRAYFAWCAKNDPAPSSGSATAICLGDQQLSTSSEAAKHGFRR